MRLPLKSHYGCFVIGQMYLYFYLENVFVSNRKMYLLLSVANPNQRLNTFGICASLSSLTMSFLPLVKWICICICKMYLCQIAKCICCCPWQMHIKDVTLLASAPPSHYVSPPIGESWGRARARVMNGSTEIANSVLQSMKIGTDWVMPGTEKWAQV